MSATPPARDDDRRWPRSVYGVGSEPDPRFTFANERTFLAWIRTALGFLAAGVAIAAVAQLTANLGLEVRVASIALIVCGVVCGVGALTRWMKNERAMRLDQPLPSSRMLLVLTGVLVVVAAVALVVVSVTPVNGPWDPGLQNERTGLAWQRTMLSGLTCSLLMARLLAGVSIPLAIVTGLTALGCTAGLGWVAVLRFRRNNADLYAGRPVGGGLPQLLLTAVLIATAVGALSYVIAV